MLKVFRMGLQTKLILAFALVLLIPTAIIAGYSISSATNALISEAQADQLAEMTLETNGITGFLRAARTDILTLSQISNFIPYLRSVAANDTVRAGQDRGDIKRALLLYIKEGMMFNRISFIDRIGQEIVRAELANAQPTIVPDAELRNVADQDYFQEALKLTVEEVFISRLEFASPIGSNSNSQPTLHLALPVVATTNQAGGVLVADISAQAFLRLISDNNPNEAAYLVDSDGKYLAGPDLTKPSNNALNTGSNFIIDHPNDAPQILAQSKGTLFGSIDQPDMLQTFMRVNPFDKPTSQWTLYRAEPISNVLDKANSARLVVVLLSVASLVSAVLIGTLIARGIVRPVRELSQAAAEISRGHWDTPVPVYAARDEIGQLTTAFANMAKELGTTIALQQHARELEIAKKLAEENSRLKTSFISMVSHDFRTPLTVISTAVSLVDKYADKMTGEDRHKHFARVQTTVKEMVLLLDEVLTIGQDDTGRLKFNLEPIDLAPFCQALIEEMKTSSLPAHEVTFSYTGENTKVRADKMLMRQIVTHLLSNAMLYSPEGSQVRVDLTMHGSNAEVCVEDKGIGIPANDQKHIFEPFHRGTNIGPQPGHGLGLAVVKKAVDMHGGIIRFDSAIGRGTMVVVTLPIVITEDKSPAVS